MAAHVWPELRPEIADEPANKALGRPQRRLLPGRHARRQPAVFDHVIEHVAGHAAPGGSQMAVTTRRQEDGFHRITRSRPYPLPTRLEVAWIFTPDGAESRFERARDCHVRLALDITLGESAPRAAP